MQSAIGRTETRRLLGRASALRFIILLGIVSLFADMTYEGARSITGPYLGVLGASATIVGIVSGVGELVGYALRLASGWIGDRTQRYWAVTIFGYTVNLLAVPLLALAGSWEIAAALMIAERMGKAIRTPARDAMLSHAAGHTGLGWGFGLHEAMDQAGAIIGPLVVSAVLAVRYGYAEAFAVLFVPAIIAIALIVAARFYFPQPRDFDISPPALHPEQLKRSYWIFIAAIALIGAGYADFPLIAYHFGQAQIVSTPVIPILYAVAMATDAAAALVLGPLFDRRGIVVIIIAAALAAAASPLVFLGGATLAFAGMILWGIGMGMQESIMRAAVASMTAPDRRATAYGIFNAAFGFAWFAGSIVLGIVYDQSVLTVALLSLILQLLSIPLLLTLIFQRGAQR
jgi:MFS family permease